MVFSSLIFLFIFLPATLLVHACSPKKLRNFVLFIASLVFYAWGEPVYVFLMLATTVIDYTIGRMMERADHREQLRKLLLLTSVVTSIAVLGLFKYYSFFALNIESLTGIPMPEWDPPLPIGISFYTFQTLSYMIDVYRRKVYAQRNFIHFGCYVAFFPQLIAGPIVRYTDIEKELHERNVTSQQVADGSRLFLIGLGKKVLLANNIGLLWDEVSILPGGELTVGTAWLGIIAFAMQIYYDFSGYSDMARGLGKMFGFQFPINFDYPYVSQSITDFWRRWHMTLGTWFREYVYIPLGGNRVSKFRWMLNIFIVWLLTGLWHGASWNFVLWGLYFAVILWFEKTLIWRWLERMPRLVRHLYACVLILGGWVLFSFESLSSIYDYSLAMIGLQSGLYDPYTGYSFSSYVVILLICFIGATPWPKRWWSRFAHNRSHLGAWVLDGFTLVVGVLSIAYLVDATYNPFLYFRF